MNLEKLFSLLQEIRETFVASAGEDTVLRSVDLPLEMSISFALTRDQEVYRAWEIKIRDICSLPEQERFILTSVPGREFVVRYLSNSKLELSSVFEQVYPLCLDEEWSEILRRIEQKEATEISKKLLLNCLYGMQLQDFQKTEAFIVFAENEKFLVSKENYLSLDEEDHPKDGFCIHPKDWMPVYDQMLGIKLLLESNLPLFYALANKRKPSFRERLSAALILGQINLSKTRH